MAYHDVSWYCRKYNLDKKFLEEVNNRLKNWRTAIEGNKLNVNGNKTEHIEYEFGEKEQIRLEQVMAISSDKKFKYSEY